MEPSYCSIHKEQLAIEYCPMDNVLYCEECLDKHTNHLPISVARYLQIKGKHDQLSFLNEFSSALTNAKLKIKNVCEMSEALHNRLNILLMKSISYGNLQN